jgi:hypothetical protein
MAGFGGIYCFDFFSGRIWQEVVVGSFSVSFFCRIWRGSFSVSIASWREVSFWFLFSQ